MASTEKTDVESDKFELDRLNALSDGVIAIALTLLVLGIDIPENHNFQADGLKKFLIKLEPSLVAYISSFFIVAVYWIQHHRVYRVLKFSNQTIIIFNILFLFAITLVPFVSKVRALYRYDALVILIFASAHIFTGLILFATWRYFIKHPELLKLPMPDKMKSNVSWRLLVNPLICILAIFVAFINIHVGTYFFMLIPISYLFMKNY